MTILVTGPKGFVGSRIMKQYPDAIGAAGLRDADEGTIAALLERVQPDVIIHTAAISDIGTCAANPEASYQANVVLPTLLARHSGGAKLVFFSSDQVYSGCEAEGPYTEDTVNPANLYARHKLEMEERVLGIDPGAVLLRAEWMYDNITYRDNYFNKVARQSQPLAFSSTQYRGVTYLREVAESMDAVMGLPGGAYNFGSETGENIYAITRRFLDLLGRDIPLTDCGERHNLWMDCSKARAGGVQFSDVFDGLKKCAGDYGYLGG